MNGLVVAGFVLIVFIMGGMVWMIRTGAQSARRARMMTVIKGQSPHEKSGNRSEKIIQDRRRDALSKKLKDQKAGNDEKKSKSLSVLLEQGGLKISPMRFWVSSVVFAVVLTLAAKILGMSGFVVIMAFITGLLGFPRLFLRHRIKRRQKKFLEEFADALEAMVRLLRAGMPVTEAIAMASREFAGPVGEEMSRIYEAQKVGISMPEATLAAARRMPLTEMQMFATGIAIQQQTGASLSEVLTNLAGVIRARYRLKRKVQALSSEAKASAMIIGSLPFLVGGGLYFIDPSYIGILFNTMPGRLMLVGGALWMSIGIFIMRAMINFKV